MPKNNVLLPPLYKLLDGDQSCHGGSYTWSLPTPDGPGEWHEITEPLCVCKVGFHLTSDPRRRTHGDEDKPLGIYLVEVDPKKEVQRPSGNSDEWVVARVRLVRPIVGDERDELLKPFRLVEKPNKVWAVLHDGRCNASSLVWPLPTKDTPGEWIEQPSNSASQQQGIRVTTDPGKNYQVRCEVYEVEVDGEVFVDKYGDLRVQKARLLRRLGSKELDKLGVGVERRWRSGSLAGKGYSSIRKRDPKGMAPAERFVQIMVEHGGADTTDPKHDVDSYVRQSIEMAIVSGLEFKKADLFAKFGNEMKERFYVLAIGTGNKSACTALEGSMGRLPWVWMGNRLAHSSKLAWQGWEVKVTSFDDTTDHLVACAYEEQVVVNKHGQSTHERTKVRVAKRFTISHAEFDAVAKLHKKAVNAEVEFRRMSSWLIQNEHISVNLNNYFHWTKEEREEIATWIDIRKDKEEHYKTRVGNDAPPAILTKAKKDELADTPVRNAIKNEVYKVLGDHPSRSDHSSDYEYGVKVAVWRVQCNTLHTTKMDTRETEIGRLELAVKRWRQANYEGSPSDYLEIVKPSKRRAAK